MLISLHFSAACLHRGMAGWAWLSGKPGKRREDGQAFSAWLCLRSSKYGDT
jgi:hypothetical protein